MVTVGLSAGHVGARACHLQQLGAAGGVTIGMEPVLSLYPGIDILGRGFEEEGYQVLRGPDPLWGGDVRRFHAGPGIFAGIIAGPPCQDFSCARRAEPSGEGLELLAELVRVIEEARPDWWLVENVPRVPTVQVPGYRGQRLDVAACDFGLPQRRLRHFQFGSRDGIDLIVPRGVTVAGTAGAAMACEGKRERRRGWADFCALQGLEPLKLPGMTLQARYRAVGNAVPLPVARAFARAIRHRLALASDRGVTACECGCGRPVAGKRRLATGGCRQRMLRRRRHVEAIGGAGPVTDGLSLGSAG